MSSSDDDDGSRRAEEDEDESPSKSISQASLPAVEIDEPDDDTLRVLISTDNHLGYLESDPVRGQDSFAAFEEVLYLAKLHKADMVLLGGDLFHHNKPSRRTLYKTMDILRRYTMGPDPVKIQILSDQAKDFRNIHGGVNYEDENYSVDLPIFSIHGNHDDPSRDPGSNTMLAALDLLSVSNFVNYFGRQEEVNKVEVSPVLVQKGTTKVALYGLGNMRDERLSRMWQQKKVKFLRPDNNQNNNDKDDDDDDDGDQEEQDFFNIFILHQNRDNMGRGAKNCVHESMIPSWMDLAIFGHEHASEPGPSESLVGTFRITQPGSTVATSLTTGEAERKHAIILNVRGPQFRMEEIPLTMVRSFVMKDVSLQEHDNLDPEDPKVDSKITKILEEELRMWIFNAQNKQTQLLQDAEKAGNFAASDPSPLQYHLEKRDQVLVRLRVEHTGFTTLNNQRFGARFVGDVANPTDILLFQRAKKQRATSKGGGKKRSTADALEEPMEPIELQTTSVETLVADNLMESQAKLNILPERALAAALEEFVDKLENGAINEMAEKGLKKKQRYLINSANNGGDEEAGEAVNSAQDVKKLLEKYTQQEEERTQSKRKRAGGSDDDESASEEDLLDKENKANGKKGRASPKKSSSKSKSKASTSIDIDSSDEDMVAATQSSAKSSKSRSRASTTSSKSGGRKSGDIRDFATKRSSQPSASQKTSSKRKKKEVVKLSDEDEDDSEVEIVQSKKRVPAQRRRTARAKVNYSYDNSSDEQNSDDDFDAPPPKKKSQTSRGGGGRSQGRRGKSQDSSVVDLDDNWGSASTRR